MNCLNVIGKASLSEIEVEPVVVDVFNGIKVSSKTLLPKFISIGVFVLKR